MKRHFLLATMLLAATQAACSTQYRIEMDPEVFLATWNRDMHGPDMTLSRHRRDGDAELVSEQWLVVTQNTRDRSWTLIAPEAVGQQTCNELLVAGLGVSRSAADALFARAQKEKRFKDGNLDFEIAHEGGLICRVAVSDSHN